MAATRNVRWDQGVRMGVQVKTLNAAPPGAPRPKTGDMLLVQYTGWLKTPIGKGKQFDTSRGGFGPFQKGPFKFALGRNRVIKAWDIGVAKMRVGETALLTCSSDLCYGRDGAGPIPPDADLIFEVELLGVDGYQPNIFEQQRAGKPKMSMLDEPRVASLNRRLLLGPLAAMMLGVPMASAKDIQLMGVTYTPAAMVLQMAEQTASMEGIMRRSAKEVASGMTTRQREEAGATNAGPGVIERGDMIQSIEVMITNSKIDTIAREASGTLRAVQLTAKSGKGPLSSDEYLAMAKLYAAAREDLRRAFEAFTAEQQDEGKALVRRLRAQDDARMAMAEAVALAEEQEMKRAAAKTPTDAGTRQKVEPPGANQFDAKMQSAMAMPDFADMQKALYAK